MGTSGKRGKEPWGHPGDELSRKREQPVSTSHESRVSEEQGF